MIVRADIRKLRDTAREYKRRFNNAETIEEMAAIRDEFYKMPYNEDYLDKLWDYIDGSQECLRSKNIELPVDEIVSMYERGDSFSSIARCYCTSFQTIKRRIDDYYGG